jgi:AP2-associated kinase
LLDPGLSETEAILEGTIHASLSGHENVVTLHAHDVFVPRRRERNAAKEPVRETRAALFVMDLCAESLADFVRQRDGLTETEALLACASAAHAVAHMHARDPPVIHRDVKPENVLRTSSSSDDDDEKNETKDACETHDKSDDDASTSTSQWRLCDFGSAAVGERLFSSSRDRSSAETEFTKNTTPTYRSPEMWDPVRFQASGVSISQLQIP